MEKELYDQIFQIENIHWWYTTRQKIVFDWLDQVLINFDEPIVLDVGCGTGFNIDKLNIHGLDKVIGIDISFDALDYGRERSIPNLICGDAANLPLKEESFDIILALDLIEHLDNDNQAIYELHRLLKTDGMLIIFTPAMKFLWGLQDEISHHRRRYTIRELRQKMTSVGLVPEKLSYVNMFLFPVIWAGRFIIRLIGYHRIGNVSENDITPKWSNRLLGMIFSVEIPLLRRMNLPIGVSILGVFKKCQPIKSLH